MYSIYRPTEEQIKALIKDQKDRPFAYSPTEITKNVPQSGYVVDHNRVQLGKGVQDYQAGIEALRNWRMFNLGWVNISDPTTPIEKGECVAVIASHMGFWSLHTCRIVYVIDEKVGADENTNNKDNIEKFGFAYGTLPAHAERGEERFTIEWHKRDNSVWYDILAISKPGFMALLGYPYTRFLQKQFAIDSKRAMQQAVSEFRI